MAEACNNYDAKLEGPGASYDCINCGQPSYAHPIQAVWGKHPMTNEPQRPGEGLDLDKLREALRLSMDHRDNQLLAELFPLEGQQTGKSTRTAIVYRVAFQLADELAEARADTDSLSESLAFYQDTHADLETRLAAAEADSREDRREVGAAVKLIVDNSPVRTHYVGCEKDHWMCQVLEHLGRVLHEKEDDSANPPTSPEVR